MSATVDQSITPATIVDLTDEMTAILRAGAANRRDRCFQPMEERKHPNAIKRLNAMGLIWWDTLLRTWCITEKGRSAIGAPDAVAAGMQRVREICRQHEGWREKQPSRRKREPKKMDGGFRYFAMYRHPERDTAASLAVSQDKTRVVMLTRRTKDGKSDLATIEQRPVHGIALVKVPFWMALDRKLNCEEIVLGERPWHKKDFRTHTREEELEAREYYEFARIQELAREKNVWRRKAASNALRYSA